MRACIEDRYLYPVGHLGIYSSHPCDPDEAPSSSARPEDEA